MRIQGKNLLFKIILWLVTEMLLNLLNLPINRQKCRSIALSVVLGSVATQTHLSQYACPT